MTKLQKRRKQLGIRQTELARRLQITRQCVCVAERKGIRNARTAERYAAALQCRPEDLMEFAGREPKNDHI